MSLNPRFVRACSHATLAVLTSAGLAHAAEQTFLTGTGSVVHQALPDGNYSQIVTAGLVTANRIAADQQDGTPAGQEQGLLRFNNIFANDGGPIPLNADIHYAGMRLVTSNTSAQGARFHRMLSPWSPSSTWNGMVNGIQNDNIEAISGPVVTTGPLTTTNPRTYNVAGSVQSWSSGATNNGWGILGDGTDGWEFTHFTSSSVNNRPQMKVVYSPQVAGAIDVSFQQGVNGYNGTRDTRIRGAAPDDNSFAENGELSVDGEDGGQPTQSLLKFMNLFAHEGGSIPSGATIVSAWLDLNHVDQGHGADVHRMLTSWNESSTWNALGGGVQADGVDAIAGAEAHLDGIFYNPTGNASNLITGSVIFDVTASVQAWANGAVNEGWGLLPFNTDGWRFSSSEGTVAPTLHIRFVPEPASLVLLSLGGLLLARRKRIA